MLVGARTVGNAIAGMLAALSVALASDLDANMKGAMQGDYTAQRNVAYLYFSGDGTPKNPIEACSWRLVVLATQHALVTETDVSGLESACQLPTVLAAAQPRAEALALKIKARVRTVVSDLADLTDGRCPGARCAADFKPFSDSYARATTGEIDSIRMVASCLAKRCASDLSFNLFQACIWARALAKVGGAALTRDDRILENTTCGFLGARAAALADVQVPVVLALGRPKKAR